MTEPDPNQRANEIRKKLNREIASRVPMTPTRLNTLDLLLTEYTPAEIQDRHVDLVLRSHEEVMESYGVTEEDYQDLVQALKDYGFWAERRVWYRDHLTIWYRKEDYEQNLVEETVDMVFNDIDKALWAITDLPEHLIQLALHHVQAKTLLLFNECHREAEDHGPGNQE